MALTFHRLTVRRRVDESDDASSFELDVPPDLADAFTYRPGQFLTFRVPWGELTLQRCYSLSSAPGLDAHPRVTVKRVAGGRVSNWLCDHVREGTVLEVSPPDGRFVLDPRTPDDVPMVLFGGGSGITPLLSILRAALADTRRTVHLLYANRDADHIIFRDTLDDLARAFPDRLTVHHHLDAERGLLSAADLAEHLRGREHGEVWICGPAPFMTAVEQAVAHASATPQRVHVERFASPPDPDRRAPAAGPSVAEEAPETYTLVLDGREHTIPVLPGETLLASALAAGVNAPHSCTEGFCGSCMAQRTSGDVRMDHDEALTAAQRAAGRVLLCQARPTSRSPLRVDMDLASFGATSGGAEEGAPRPLPLGPLLAVIAIGAALIAAVRALH